MIDLLGISVVVVVFGVFVVVAVVVGVAIRVVVVVGYNKNR